MAHLRSVRHCKDARGKELVFVHGLAALENERPAEAIEKPPGVLDAIDLDFAAAVQGTQPNAESVHGQLLTDLARSRTKKKPTWRNTRRYSTTSAYSLTSLPARPGCPQSSHPTISLESRGQLRRRSSHTLI